MTKSNDVIKWYLEKTDSIINKYGPGPIIHFHTGIYKKEKEYHTLKDINIALKKSQSDLISYLDKIWNFKKLVSNKKVIDVGAGLGGTSIYLTTKFETQVYSLTNIKKHAELIAKFASDALVKSKVHTVIGDAHDIPGKTIFECVIALESTCYLDREKWFNHISSRIVPGGVVLIADCVGESQEVFKPFNDYWKTDLGTLIEYKDKAEAAGLIEVQCINISHLTQGFWNLNREFSRMNLMEPDISLESQDHYKKSIEWYTKLLGFWETGKIKYLLMKYVKPNI